MSDPVAVIARATAGRLATGRTPTISQELEVALLARDGATRAEAYALDPISLGSLVVAIATLAWTVHSDLQNRRTRPNPEVLARTLRVRLRSSDARDNPERDRIIDVVVEETIRVGAPPDHDR